MNFLWGLIVGIIVSTVVCLMWLSTKKVEPKRTSDTGFASDDEKRKAENFQKISDFIADKDKFTNDDLENLLKVSNTTIGRYLDELEEMGKIKQVGVTGKFVYYIKK